MKKKILFIDDEKYLCDKAGEFLTRNGFDVITANDGAKGIELLKKEEVPLIITDIMMPEIDGLEVLKYVQDNLPNSLAIIITGYGSMDSAIEALRKNAYDFIVKPFDYHLLLISVNRAFDVLSLRELKEKAEKKIERLSITDNLTGLFNRRHFFTILSKEIKRAKRYNKYLSLMILDLDHFKYFNDTYGHLEGDKVLKTFGKILTECIREIDLCFRYGGEEFAVIMPEIDIDKAFNVAERIRATIQNVKFSLKGLGKKNNNSSVTTSIGLAEYKNEYPMEHFVRHADELLYKSKELGRNRVCFDKAN